MRAGARGAGCRRWLREGRHVALPVSCHGPGPPPSTRLIDAGGSIYVEGCVDERRRRESWVCGEEHRSRRELAIKALHDSEQQCWDRQAEPAAPSERPGGPCQSARCAARRAAARALTAEREWECRLQALCDTDRDSASHVRLRPGGGAAAPPAPRARRQNHQLFIYLNVRPDTAYNNWIYSHHRTARGHAAWQVQGRSA